MTDIENDRWLGLSEQGEPLSPITLYEAGDGAFHAASHVWVWRVGVFGEIEFLLQRRSEKQTWPGYLDISAAGHVDYGEDPITTALKETEEEIGLKITREDLSIVGVCRSYAETTIADRDIIENELRWIYVTRWKDDYELAFADGEVDATYWLSLDEFRKIIAGSTDDKIVDHGDAYYTMLIEAVERLAAR